MLKFLSCYLSIVHYHVSLIFSIVINIIFLHTYFAQLWIASYFDTFDVKKNIFGFAGHVDKSFLSAVEFKSCDVCFNVKIVVIRSNVSWQPRFAPEFLTFWRICCWRFCSDCWGVSDACRRLSRLSFCSCICRRFCWRICRRFCSRFGSCGRQSRCCWTLRWLLNCGLCLSCFFFGSYFFSSYRSKCWTGCRLICWSSRFPGWWNRRFTN